MDNKKALEKLDELEKDVMAVFDINDKLKAEKEHLEFAILGAKVSLDKFFDKEYELDIVNQACDVREMYCKLGDKNNRLESRLRETIELISCAVPLAWLFHEPDGGEYHKTAGEWEKRAEAIIAKQALEDK